MWWVVVMNYRNESEECTRRIDIPVDDDAPTMTLAVPRVRKMRQRSEREMGEAGRARKLEAEGRDCNVESQKQP